MMRKKLLVMPGTRWQLELVRKIHEMGHFVAIVDPHDDAPCVAEADAYLKSDIFSRDNVLKFCRQQNIEGVLSDECDIVMGEIAAIGKEYGLPALSPNSAALFTDKFKMRERCAKIGVAHPEYRLCSCVDEAVDFLRVQKRPIILKPLDSNSSHGVFTAITEKDVRDRFAESMSFSRSEKRVLAERYVVGTEFTIDGIKTPHMHYTLAISEKKHFKHNDNIANELFFTHSNDRFDYDLLRATNDKFIMGSGLDFGFTHAEYKYEDGKFYQIEIAARGGGNMISSVITQFMSGHDTYRYLIDCACGNTSDADFTISPKCRERAAVLKFFATPQGGGRVAKINGLDVLAAEPDVVQYKMNFKPGDVIEDAVSDSARIGFYIACSDTKDKLLSVMEEVETAVGVEYEK